MSDWLAGPEPRRALEKYRRIGRSYDRRTAFARRYRRRAVELLGLRPGGRVLDVACGTGANFALLERLVGPDGMVVGIDLSPEMLGQARDRVLSHGWTNTVLIEGRIEDAELEGPFDAALFSLTHDVLQSRAGVENVFASLRAGGRVASFGPKEAHALRVPVNLAVRLLARPYVTTLENLDRPWRELERLVPDLSVESVALGGAYLASGTKEASGCDPA